MAGMPDYQGQNAEETLKANANAAAAAQENAEWEACR
jgi:hypothetical protein